MMCLVFVGFCNCFYNCYTVLMFALLVANWQFCINKFELIWFDWYKLYHITVVVISCLSTISTGHQTCANFGSRTWVVVIL